jgi:hypothetical protein
MSYCKRSGDNKVEDDLKDTAGTTGSSVKVKHTEQEEERRSQQLQFSK